MCRVFFCAVVRIDSWCCAVGLDLYTSAVLCCALMLRPTVLFCALLYVRTIAVLPLAPHLHLYLPDPVHPDPTHPPLFPVVIRYSLFPSPYIWFVKIFLFTQPNWIVANNLLIDTCKLPL